MTFAKFVCLPNVQSVCTRYNTETVNCEVVEVQSSLCMYFMFSGLDNHAQFQLSCHHNHHYLYKKELCSVISLHRLVAWAYLFLHYHLLGI